MNTYAFVLAGGCGKRLLPLTAHEAKPALEFARGIRLIDFVLSNLVHSGVRRICVLAQYAPRSLVEHVHAHWAPLLHRCGGTIEVVLPDPGTACGSFRGTADAVRQTLHLSASHRPDLVAVFAADHVYRMDVREMIGAHVARRAEISVATLPVPLERAGDFGIVRADATGRIRAFQEKPKHPWPMPAQPGHACASMGNYLFDPEVVRSLLDAAAARGDTDFGHHLLPQAIKTCRVCAYDFAAHRVPGTRPFEEPHYWRDVGTVQAYRAAQRDVEGPTPRFSLDNERWPILGLARPGRAAAVAHQARLHGRPGQSAPSGPSLSA